MNISIVYGVITDYAIVPRTPVKGDVVKVEFWGDPLESINVSISYSKPLNLTNGGFIWDIGFIDVVENSNYFYVSSDNVTLLRVTSIISSIPITQTDYNIDGKTMISRRNMDLGTYWLQVSGECKEKIEHVSLVFYASAIINLDDAGYYTTSYNTSSIPSGVFNVSFGNFYESIKIEAHTNILPIPYIEHNKIAQIGESIIFNASNSFDPDGDIVEYFWDFGDNASDEGEIVTHRYEFMGNYTIKLRVVDDLGLKSIEKSIIQVYEYEPNTVDKVPENKDKPIYLFQKYVKIFFAFIIIFILFFTLARYQMRSHNS